MMQQAFLKQGDNDRDKYIFEILDIHLHTFIYVHMYVG